VLKLSRLGTMLIVALFAMNCAPAAAPSPTAAPPEVSKGKPTEAQKPAAPTAPVTPAATAPPAPAPAKPAAAADKADVEAARAEGGVVWYTSTPLRQAQVVAEAFEKKYGFKVELFRTGGEQVIQRFQTEAAAGKTVVDLLTASDPAAFNDMIRKNQLTRFRPENFDKVPESARNEDAYWVSQRLNLLTIAYRSDKETEAEMPKRWVEVGDAKYKGKLVHADPSFTANASQIVSMLSRDLGWDYYESLKKNDMLIVQGHQQLAQILSTGERTIGAEAGSSDMWDLQEKGIAITLVYPEEGSFVIPAPTGVVAGAPHPNAGKLLAEFMLSDEAQKLFPEAGFYAARSDMPPPKGFPAISDLKVKPIDLQYVEDNEQKVKQRFAEIFSN
jgi:iron(III) transport system substrate-binding protein